MLIHPLLEKLKTLKLYGMLKALEQQLQIPTQDLSFEERFGLILDQEASLRENRGLSKERSRNNFRFFAQLYVRLKGCD